MDLSPDVCYRALTSRDARFDGRFFIGVRSTGVYCRPICPARTPHRRNISFYPCAAAAAEGIDAAEGLADGLALGEWVHGGDVRDALGHHDAFVSAGIDLALPLLVERSRQRGASAVVVSTDREELRFGVDEGPVATLRTDRATFVRLCAGRAPDPSRYHLVGVDEAALAIFS